MNNFRFFNPTEIIFGKDTQSVAGAETKKYGAKALLHYGGGSIKRSGLYGQIVDSLRESKVDFAELGGVEPNPRLSLVNEGVDLCRKEGIDFILAVGGGSVIDSAKAIAMGVPYDGDVWDFFIGRASQGNALPIGVVLTIPAAGSESSNGCVITDWENKNKLHFDFDKLRPRFAIMNPELTFTLPPYQTACGALDIMAHVMERYFTQTRNVELTDRLCEATLKTIIQNTPVVLRQPDNYDTRAEIMWAGTIANNDLLSTGRVGDWASHMIEHALSATNDVAHGAGLAIIFPAWMKHVYRQDLHRFTQFAVRVWNVEQRFDSPEQTALEGIDRLKSFSKSIGLPTSLKEIGITEKGFDNIVKKYKRSGDGTVGNFVKLTDEDINQILEIAK
ncbi:MAG: iron-containing alcohol dehydrogenase [Eubacteriales bacterium]|nr:iron-containing alcohol dehydrogenase [Eubacteriales bacterium]